MPDTPSLQKDIANIETLIASLRETLSGDELEGALKPLEKKLEGLNAKLIGSSAIAQDGSKAVGRQGVLLEGSIGSTWYADDNLLCFVNRNWGFLRSPTAAPVFFAPIAPQ